MPVAITSRKGSRKPAFVGPAGVEIGAGGEAGRRDVEDPGAKLAHGAAAGDGGFERLGRDGGAEGFAFLDGPMLDEVPGGVERALVVEQADPQGGKRADPAPAPAIGAAHFEEALEADFGEGGGEVVGPVGDRRLFAGKLGKLAVEEGAEAFAGAVDVAAVAHDEIHRHVERVVAVAFVAEAVFEHLRQHAGAVGVGVGPDVAAEGFEAVGLAFGQRRIGEQRGGERLEGQADAEFLHHVGFGAVVEIDLDGTGPKHHVEPERADARHVAEHDARSGPWA